MSTVRQRVERFLKKQTKTKPNQYLTRVIVKYLQKGFIKICVLPFAVIYVVSALQFVVFVSSLACRTGEIYFLRFSSERGKREGFMRGGSFAHHVRIPRAQKIRK